MSRKYYIDSSRGIEFKLDDESQDDQTEVVREVVDTLRKRLGKGHTFPIMNNDVKLDVVASTPTLYKIRLESSKEASLQAQLDALDAKLGNSNCWPFRVTSQPTRLVAAACKEWKRLQESKGAQYRIFNAPIPEAAGASGQSSTSSESPSAAGASGQSSAGTAVKGLQETLNEQLTKSGGEYCSAETDAVDDVSGGAELEMMQTIFENLPECKRMTGVGSSFKDGFSAGQKSQGCEQVNLMLKKFRLVNKTVSCIVKRRIQTSNVSVMQETDLLVSNVTCKGDVNINAENSADIKAIQKFSTADVDDIMDITTATVKDVFDTEQLSQNGFMGQGDGNKNLQVSLNDIENIKKDKVYETSLQSALIHNFQKVKLKVTNVSGGGDCNITAKNYSNVVSHTIMDLIAKRVKETKIATTVDSIFKSKQTSKNSGIEALIEAFFDGLSKMMMAPMIVVGAIVAGVIIVVIILAVALNPGDEDSPFGQMMMHEMRQSGGPRGMHRTRKSAMMRNY